MKNHALILFSNSLSRCKSDEAFLETFYRNFLGSSEEIAKRFAETDMDLQKSRLMESLELIRDFIEDSPVATLHMRNRARTHARDRLNITPELYKIWRSKLIRSVEAHDPKFDSETQSEWEYVLDYVTKFMITHY